jgi:hypothetical protein
MGAAKVRDEAGEMGQSPWVVAHFKDPPEPSIIVESVCTRDQLQCRATETLRRTAPGHSPAKVVRPHYSALSTSAAGVRAAARPGRTATRLTSKSTATPTRTRATTGTVGSGTA